MKNIIIIICIAFANLLCSQNSDGFKYNIGEQIPNLKFTDLNNYAFELSELRGKPVLINLFATWCKPCLKEMNLLSKEITSKYNKSQIEVLAIGYEHIPLELEYFIENHDFNFTYIPDFEKIICNTLVEQGVPKSILIDTNGKIIEQKAGFDYDEYMVVINRIRRLIDKEGTKGKKHQHVTLDQVISLRASERRSKSSSVCSQL